MNLILKLTAGVVLLPFFASCIVESDPESHGREELVQMTFSSDVSGQTKTSLADGKKVHWTKGDIISVFDDLTSDNRPFEESGIDGNNAEFTGYSVSGASEYIALYPYLSSAEYVDGVISTVLPAGQKSVAGSFDTDLNIMVAKTSDSRLSFRNVCALLKITIPQTMSDVTAVTVSSDSPLCGDMNISFDADGNPEMVPADPEAGKEVTVSDGGAVLAPGIYYLVVAPGEHRLSLKMTTKDNGTCVRFSSASKEIEANQIINLGTADYTSSRHPCALVTESDISRVKAAVSKASASDPVYAAYLKFCGNKYAQASYTASPVATLVRGDVTGTGVASENYMNAARDAAAAFQLALRWKISGETKYADASVAILDAWASTCTGITANDNNQYLAAGFQGYTFANAAELMRDYPGWNASDQDDFKLWLRNVWLTKNEWFIDTHGGDKTCNLHYWSNWELANLASMLAIGIYLDDESLVAKVRNNFLNGEGSGAVGNMIPYSPFADPQGHGMLAQNMESGRDQGHATLVISMCAELCQMAWNIGMDFWGQADNKVLAMSQYTAKYNVKPDGAYICDEMPFTPYSYCPSDCGCSNHSHGAEHAVISDSGRGKERPGWDLIYSHYKHEKQVSADEVYYVKLFADQLRYTYGVLTGDGGSGDSRYGTTSAAFDQIGWGTMLFYRGE